MEEDTTENIMEENTIEDILEEENISEDYFLLEEEDIKEK